MLSKEKDIKEDKTGRRGKPERILLTGFRGTGKSVVGAGLAEKLGYEFIDTDILVAEELQSSIADFVNREGWDAFRGAEEKILEKLVQSKDAVIATGGGAIMHHKAWQNLRKNSLVIWLQAEPETIRKRIEQDGMTVSQRPSLGGSSLSGEISEVLEFRKPYYEKGSDLAIDTTKMSPEDIIEYTGRILSGEATQ